MSCPYYWYNNHYACRKSGKDVNEDTYSKFCKNYNYGDCPIYKGTDTSGCFLTSACVEAKGLDDDCHELTVLRAFRDEWLSSQPFGQAAICEYYHIAPQIVDCIKKHTNSKAVFEKIYTDIIVPCVELIAHDNHIDAYLLYKSSVTALKKQYIE